MSSPKPPPYNVHFYSTDTGSVPVESFFDDLPEAKRSLLLAAVEAILQHQGKDVCDTEFGKPL